MSDLDKKIPSQIPDWRDMYEDEKKRRLDEVENVKKEFQHGYGLLSFEDALALGFFSEGYTEKDREAFDVAMEFANEHDIKKAIEFLKINLNEIGTFTYMLQHVYSAGDLMPMEQVSKIIAELIKDCK